jgi:murein DD-endopeptidase MepM/ murein hydrolase activator NlpD
VVVVGGSVAGLATAREGTDPRVRAARGAVEDLRRDLEMAMQVLDDLEERVAGARVQLGGIREAVVAADTELRLRREQLDRRSSVATDVVTTGRIPRRPVTDDGGTEITLADLRAPLRVVNRAIHASDELSTTLIGQQSAIQEQAAAARQVLAATRGSAFELGSQDRAVRAELSEAIRSAFMIAGSTSDPDLQEEAAALVERARAELRQIDVAREELRRQEAEVLQTVAGLDERLSDLRTGMRDARRTTDELYGQMAVAELLVEARLAGWEGVLGGEVPVLDEGVFRVCPVDEPKVYSDNWHAPRWGGGFHLHQGIDIFAPTGTPIRAPFDGLAVTADNWLGGLAVKVYGDNGYVYNAHLSAHGQLGAVKAGAIIGFVGETGNASGPHDHFEFHPDDGEAINPMAFLDAVC